MSETLNITIDDSLLDDDVHEIEVSDFAADEDDAQIITLTDGADISEVSIEEIGNGDDEADEIHIDLTTFDDDFSVDIQSEGSEDTFFVTIGDDDKYYFEDDGEVTIKYLGTDGSYHVVMIDPGSASIEFIDDNLVVDGTDGDDVMNVGYVDSDNDEIDGSDGINDTIMGYGGDDTINAGDGADTVDGGAGADTIDGGAGADTIEGGASDDILSGGAGDDTIFGDSESPGLSYLVSDPLTLDQANLVSDTSSGDDNAHVGDTAIYSNVGLLSDGTEVSARLVVVSTSNSDLNVDLSGGSGAILLNHGAGGSGSGGGDPAMEGETVTLRLEFFNPITGDPLTFNAVMTFGDIDQASNGTEMVQINAADFLQYGVSDTSGLVVTNSDGIISASGTAENMPVDQDAWFSGAFEGKSEIEFTLTARAGQTGYSVNGSVIDDPVVWTDTAAGDDTLYGGDGDDTLDGGDGDDTVYGEADDDTIIASTGTDTIDGGTGQDTYDAENTSTLTDETIQVVVDDDGDGTVVKVGDGTTDTVTSVETFIADEATDEADIITLSDTVTDRDDITDIDTQLAVGTFTPDNGDPVVAFGPAEAVTLADLLALNNSGSFQITGGDESGTIGNISFENFETINFDVVCFVRGTLIETDRGEVPIEDMRTDDLVRTLDNGLQPIRWINSKTVPALGHIAPIRIRAGALGNRRDLLVSPQHRMMLSGWQLELLFASGEVLATAKSLLNDHNITREVGGTVEYFHILFDTHEIIFAEGAPSESFHPGELGLGSFAEETRCEILELFPELALDIDSFGLSVRTSLKSFEAEVAMSELGLDCRHS